MTFNFLPSQEKKKDSRASVGPHPALKVHLIFSIPLPRAARKNDTKIHFTLSVFYHDKTTEKINKRKVLSTNIFHYHVITKST